MSPENLTVSQGGIMAAWSLSDKERDALDQLRFGTMDVRYSATE